ncbi:hypothetical protein HYW61_00770 [candidate division WWE3 bacterium]|nr:hypothetical protein [candidate division WWE3 bacterium]
MTSTLIKEILNRLAVIEKNQNLQFETLSARVINISLLYDQRLGFIEDRLAKIETVLFEFGARIEELENSVRSLENRVAAMGDRLFGLEARIDEIDKRTVFLPKLYDNTDKLMGEIKENRQERVFINNRLTKLEKAIVKDL